MPTYTPPTIPAGSFDGSVVDANFDLFQTATCALDGTNFANTSKLEFRHMQPGASTETFIENGNPTTIIFNAFTDMVGGTGDPYPRGILLPEQNVVHDTGVSFVAKEDGEVFVNSSVVLRRPKCHWLSVSTKRVWLSVVAQLKKSEGLGGRGAVSLTTSQRRYAWTFGETSNQRAGQEIRVSGRAAINAHQRYSFWLELYITAEVVNANGTVAPDVYPAGGTGTPTFYPTGQSVVSLYGYTRQTVATCIYR